MMIITIKFTWTTRCFANLIVCQYFTASNPNVQFRASVDGMPDLPKWLLLEQKSPLHPGFLYGTPGEKDVGEVYLEVIRSRFGQLSSSMVTQ